ncbi:hypothetical protein L2Y96_14500 [Luteibacter aegosomaticola]|uniref:hypothetical protein n=1 Tax=Luteibacter aegosomaticola TaxID=2911538 RepID=UPI001FF7F13A|nr:hypothetical protein [Luteibacter aegosomaticola]UPG88626.1 hypothetical protein L2Y96_14500 [Luteibacter aegosomaticola]
MPLIDDARRGVFRNMRKAAAPARAGNDVSPCHLHSSGEREACAAIHVGEYLQRSATIAVLQETSMALSLID